MTVENLKKQLVEKEQLKERTEMIFHQLVGQISLLQDMIAKEQEVESKKAPEEPK